MNSKKRSLYRKNVTLKQNSYLMNDILTAQEDLRHTFATKI